MATVHLGRLVGAAGFARTVAVKVLRPQYAEDHEFVSMFMDEARLAARIQHPNVVATLDVLSSGSELFLVMEYVPGETLSRLLRATTNAGGSVPAPIVVAILRDTLLGLHAAHEARDEQGHPLGVVHRDVSPQNIIVGIDGIGRVQDFGVAKASGRIQTTREGQLKGKLAYMAPEQFHGNTTRATDIFAASVVLWEALVGDRLFGGNEGEIVRKILSEPIPPPSSRRTELDAALDAVVLKGLARQPERRFSSAQEMAEALTLACPPADATTVGRWLRGVASETLATRESLVRDVESGVTGLNELDQEPAGPPGNEQPAVVGDLTRSDLSSEVKGGRTVRARWQAGLAAFAALLVGATLALLLFRGKTDRSEAAIEPKASPSLATSSLDLRAGTAPLPSSSMLPDAAAPAVAASSARAPAARSGAPLPRGASAPSQRPRLTPDHI